MSEQVVAAVAGNRHGVRLVVLVVFPAGVADRWGRFDDLDVLGRVLGVPAGHADP